MLHCFICHHPDPLYLFKLGGVRIHQCRGCDLIFLENPDDLCPQPSITETKKPSGEYPPTQTILQEAESCFQVLSSYVRGSDLRLLEIGCGEGLFLELAQSNGFDVMGIDAHPHWVQQANQRLGKTSVFEGTLQTVDPMALGTFDVCVLRHRIDYAADPETLLQQAHSLLKEKGVLLVTVASLEKDSVPLLEKGWFCSTPHSSYLFNVQNLESLLVKSGFTNILSVSPKSKNTWSSLETYTQQVSQTAPPATLKLLKTILPQSLRQKYFQMDSFENISVSQKKMISAAPQKLSIIVPVYNERKTFVDAIERVLQKVIPQVEKEIVIVESNSTDGTRELVAGYENREGVIVLYEEKPKGKGHAVRTGLTRATGDIFLIQDADLEYDIDDYDVLLAPLLSYQKMFVLGSRHSGTWKMRSFDGQPLWSGFMNFGQVLCTGLINTACHSHLKDPFTMYKVFRRECMYGLTFESNRFDFDWEIVIKFLRKKYIPLEIPVNYDSRSFDDGKKVDPIKDPITWVRALIKFRSCRLMEVPIER